MVLTNNEFVAGKSERRLGSWRHVDGIKRNQKKRRRRRFLALSSTSEIDCG